MQYELFIAICTTTMSGYCLSRASPGGLDLIGEAATSKGSCSYTISYASGIVQVSFML